MNIRIREYCDSDIKNISTLFFETVHAVNSKDYNEKQIKAWAPQVYPDDYWRERWDENCRVIVAEKDDQIVGFAEFRSSGEVDCFYVHHQHQGIGVGTLMWSWIAKEAIRYNLDKLFADVSLTARPFFEAKGLKVVRAQTKQYGGEEFKQFYMEKKIII